MGFYINEDSKGNSLSTCGKAQQLIADGAVEVNGHQFVENMVCVAKNPWFDAAAYLFSVEEWKAFAHHDDTGRPMTFLVWPHAARVSGYEHARKCSPDGC